MRRGVAGVRLCDRPACAHRWPCAVHGTASVGDYEHLGRHAGQFYLTELPYQHGVLDMESCKRCGVALCRCPAETVEPSGFQREVADAIERLGRPLSVWCDHCSMPRDAGCAELHPRCDGNVCRCSGADAVVLKYEHRAGWSTVDIGHALDGTEYVVWHDDRIDAFKLQGSDAEPFVTAEQAMDRAEELARL